MIGFNLVVILKLYNLFQIINTRLNEHWNVCIRGGQHAKLLVHIKFEKIIYVYSRRVNRLLTDILIRFLSRQLCFARHI